MKHRTALRLTGQIPVGEAVMVRERVKRQKEWAGDTGGGDEKESGSTSDRTGETRGSR
ncbi:MAG: hypothetical protein M1309_00495 [Actinobacteria bacterium]|nr:hypothetical protein [Actinomycetota bacterium]